MLVSKNCRGCKCSICRWQGTDNCYKDTNDPCSRCEGKKSKVDAYVAKSWECPGFAKAAGKGWGRE